MNVDKNVSVIVPVYKVPLNYLRECFDSLLEQTMQECEFIVVSDGAPEVEKIICREYANKDARFKFYEKEHGGVSAARNYGISKAEGEYVTFVDADDWIEKNTLKEAFFFAKKNDSDISFWNSFFYKAKKNILKSYNDISIKKLTGKDIEAIKNNLIFPEDERFTTINMVSCKLIKTIFLKSNNIFFNEYVKISEDRLFFFTCFSKTSKISYLSRAFYHYRLHDQSTSHSFIPNAFYEFTIFFKCLNEYDMRKYKTFIEKETIRSFFLSWQCYFFHKNNKNSLKENIKKLSDLIKEPSVQNAIKSVHLGGLPFIWKVEILLLRKSIFFLIYIHCIKHYIFH